MADENSDCSVGGFQRLRTWYERAFLIYSHQKKKRIASHYVFRLLFSYALHLCESWRISAKLLCYLGSFPRTPFPLHFSRLVLNLSPAVVEMIDCTECGERKIFLFALLSLIQNLFLLDVPCVSKGFNTAQSSTSLLFTICLPCHKQFKVFFTFLTRPIELICFSSFLKKIQNTVFFT